jgi:hypothetical protein
MRELYTLWRCGRKPSWGLPLPGHVRRIEPGAQPRIDLKPGQQAKIVAIFLERARGAPSFVGHRRTIQIVY